MSTNQITSTPKFDKSTTQPKWLDNLPAEQKNIIFNMIANGNSYQSIADALLLPRTALMEWLLLPEQCQLLSRAKELRSHALVEAIAEEAMNRDNDLLIQPDGKIISNPSAVSRSKLICDVKKWQAQVLNRSEYGDKQVVEQEVGGVLATFLKDLQKRNVPVPITSGRTLDHDKDD